MLRKDVAVAFHLLTRDLGTMIIKRFLSLRSVVERDPRKLMTSEHLSILSMVPILLIQRVITPPVHLHHENEIHQAEAREIHLVKPRH